MNQNGQIGYENQHSDDSIESIDWNKLRSVLRRSWYWLLFILFITNLGGYLYIRYTKPLFESSSELKLDVKEQATSLGLSPFANSYSNMDNLSGEIELINSRLFFNKVIETIDLEVQYFTYGQILDDEKYKHAPFTIKYEIKDGSFYNKPIDVTLLNENSFELSYDYMGARVENQYLFDEPFENEHFKFTLSSTPYFSDDLLDENFYFIVNSHESLVHYLESNITVEPLNLNAHTIRISFRDYNKLKAYDLVNAIDTLYLRYTNLQKNQANENKIKYLNEQMKDTEKILSSYENYFENFTIENKTVDLDEDVKKTLDNLNKLDSQRYNLRSRIKHIEEISDKIITEELEDVNIKRQYLPSYILKEIEAFDELYFEQKQLALSYKENTFAYERKKQELDLTKGSLVTNLNQYKLNLYENLSELNKKKRELEGNLLNLPSKGTEYNKSKRFYGLYEEMYLSLMKSKNEFEIARAGTVPDFKILSAATLSETPISPIKFIVYGVGLISGLIFCFLFIGINYLTSTKITSVQDVTNQTKAPIAGTLPFDGNISESSRMVVINQPKSSTSEAFRAIRTNIEFMVPNKKQKIISISSTISGEGKTFVTLNLAGVIAMSNLKVVVLDLDLRRPKIHQNFNENPSDKGISTVLINKHKIKESIRKTDTENLDYIPAGPIPPNPSELLLNGSFEKLIHDLQEKYDIILLDTPPIGLVTDAIMAMKMADLKLFVVRAEFSKNSFLQTVNRLIAMNKFTNIGIVVNGLKYGGHEYGYGYGYGNHYYETGNGKSWLKSFRQKINV